MEKVHKRFVSATKYLVAIFTVGLIFLFHKMDNGKSKDEYDMLNVVMKYVPDGSQDELTANQLDEKIREWLSKKYPEQYRKNHYSRVQLSTFLLNNGITEQELKNAKDTNSRRNVFALTNTGYQPKAPGPGVPYKAPDGKFNEQLSVFLKKVQPLSVSYVAVIDTALIDLNRIEAMLRESNEDYLRFLEGRLKQKLSKEEREETLNEITLRDLTVSARLIGDSLNLIFNWMNRRQSQRSFEPLELIVPVYVDTIPGKTDLLALTGNTGHVPDSNAVAGLSLMYGELPKAVAQQKIRDRYLGYFENMDVLGFSIPYDSFYKILFLLELLIGLSLINSMLIVQKNNWATIFDHEDEDIFEPLINSGLLRVITWGILPVLTLLFAFPSGDIGWNIKTILMTGIIMIVYGIAIGLSFSGSKSKSRPMVMPVSEVALEKAQES
ncbi:hypothetical protein [Chitinophaga sp. GbtcB8]|uniref:hypothetical protein n=1 Tax=Chitinophaga sp. GbtcB8 TaxID=2824753 RepID=UPI001C30F255|nr:hypothetical protein [Chitinophaga sp. GbtcB8]